MSEPIFPLGKLPVEMLEKILAHAPIQDERVLLGPGIGMDCAVVEAGEKLLVFKAEPITFASDEIGWYGIQVGANDLATTGADFRWYMATLLLPENKTTEALVNKISGQIFEACREMGASVIGGHTEITYGLDRPILMGTLIGEVSREQLVTPRGAAPGDRILLTKGVPIEGTALLAREFREKLKPILSQAELDEAANYLYQPGISVMKDAKIAMRAGKVTAMHDPTEGGVVAALWEMSTACGHRLRVDSRAIPVPALSKKICAFFGLDPLATIASGALLATCKASNTDSILSALSNAGIPCSDIGEVEEGPVEVWDDCHQRPLARPARDEITRVYEVPLSGH